MKRLLISLLGAAVLIAPGAALAGPGEGTLGVANDLERSTGTAILEFSVENQANNAGGPQGELTIDVGPSRP